MVEVYSKGITVASGGNIPFEIAKIEKGSYVTINNATININHCGAYRVTINGTATPSEAGTFGVELSKDSVLLENTLTQATASATSILLPFSFTTIVQVQKNNGACACLSPSVLTVVNTGVTSVFNNINVTVDKIY